VFVKNSPDTPGYGADWFAISTDVLEPRTLSGRDNLPAHHYLKLASPDLGVIGCWSEDEFHLHTGPAGHVLTFGFCPRVEFFAELVQSSCCDSAVDRLMRRLPGSFHLIVARPDGTLRVQGSASGLRRVFVTDSSAPHLASSRLDILARITDSRPDISVLGTRLLHPGLPPHPLKDRSPWQGIRAVTPGHAATLQQGKPPETRAWWTPPEPARTLEDSASELAEALHLSVTERINALPKSGNSIITADLSGGLDSTPLPSAS
jgi:asparagine synthase (glutamine-hydrolysing)